MRSKKSSATTSQNNSSVEHYIRTQQAKFNISETAFKILIVELLGMPRQIWAY